MLISWYLNEYEKLSLPALFQEVRLLTRELIEKCNLESLLPNEKYKRLRRFVWELYSFPEFSREVFLITGKKYNTIALKHFYNFFTSRHLLLNAIKDLILRLITKYASGQKLTLEMICEGIFNILEEEKIESWERKVIQESVPEEIVEYLLINLGILAELGYFKLKVDYVARKGYPPPGDIRDIEIEIT